MSVLSAQSIRRLCNPHYAYGGPLTEEWKSRLVFKPMLDPFCEEERIEIETFNEELKYDKERKQYLSNGVLKVSHGLGSASYSVRLAQDLWLGLHYIPNKLPPEHKYFGLFSTMEKFQMPNNICATVHDKSTWARRGLAVQTTFIDPGWIGFLTLEISYHGENYIQIPKGTGIAQIVFHELDETTENPYKGKYQHQGEKPQKAL